MYSHKPISLWKYLRWQKTTLDKSYKQLFYLSWEDALWDLCSKMKVGHNSLILTPAWYCVDVEQNMKNHGYRVKNYAVDLNLQPNKASLLSALKKYKPKVVILHHPLGITNHLIKDQKFLKKITNNHITIEDSVHNIIDNCKIKITSPNHYIIDSLRKTVPLQGSSLYGKESSLNFKSPLYLQSWMYRLGVTTLWCVMNLFWGLTMLTHRRLPAQLAQRIMQWGYDLIGNSTLPTSGSPVFSKLQKHLDINRIENIKSSQIITYQKHLTKLNIPLISRIKYSIADIPKLMGYPLRIHKSIAQELLLNLKQRGLILRYELAVNNWDSDYHVLCLPIGPYLNNADIKRISNIFSDSISTYLHSI